MDEGIIFVKKANEINDKKVIKTNKVIGARWGCMKKNLPNNIYDLHKNIDIDNAIDVIIIAQHNIYYNDNDVKKSCYKYSIINKDDFDATYNKNEHITEVLYDKKVNYYKLPIDIDYDLPEKPESDGIEIIKAFIKDVINFLNEYFIKDDDSKLKSEDVLIAKSCGFKEDKNVFRMSYHLIFPVIFKWDKIKIMMDLLKNNVFHKYVSNYSNSFVDTGITKTIQLFRCIYQTKAESDRVMEPLNSIKKPSDYLVGIYDESDIDKYFNIDELLNTKAIDAIDSKFLKKTNQTISNSKKFLKYKIDENLYNLDYVTCLLYTIDNDTTVISYDVWVRIIRNIIGYIVTSDRNDVIEYNSLVQTIDYENLIDHYKSVILDWTLKGYEKNTSQYHYKKQTLQQLRAICKANGMTKYSSKNKEELIKILPKVNSFTISDDIHIEHINNIFAYYIDKSKENMNTMKKGVHNLASLAKGYNKFVKKKWNEINQVPRNIHLDDQDFYVVKEFPKYNEAGLSDYADKYKFIFLQAFMGLNKTGHIINILRELRSKYDNDLKVLFVLPRATLTYTIYTRLIQELPEFNFKIYKNKNQANTQYYAKTENLKCFITTPESIHKIPEDYKYDVLILDELDTLSLSLNGSTCNEDGLKSKRLTRLFNIIQRCDNVIMAEALSSLPSVNLIRNMVEYSNSKNPIENKINDKCLAFITNDIRFNHTYKLVASLTSYSNSGIKSLLIKQLLKDANKGLKICGCITSKKMLIELQKTFDKNNIKALCIHADNKNEMKRYYVNGGAEIVENNFQVCLWTTTLGVGFSQESKNYWDIKYLYHQSFGNLTDKTITANMLLQANMRCRYMSDKIRSINDVILYDIDDDSEDIVESDNIPELLPFDENEAVDNQVTKVFLMNIINDVNNLTTDPKQIERDYKTKIQISEKASKYILKEDAGINEEDIHDIELLTKYNYDNINGDMVRQEVMKDNNDTYYNYMKDDEIKFSVNKKVFDKYCKYDLLLSPELTKINKSISISERLRNNINRQHMELMLKLLILKFKGCWDDSETIRGKNILNKALGLQSLSEKEDDVIKDVLFDIITKVIPNDDDECKITRLPYEEFIKELIYEYPDTAKDNSYFKLIDSNATNKYGDALYNQEERDLIKHEYIYHKYFISGSDSLKLILKDFMIHNIVSNLIFTFDYKNMFNWNGSQKVQSHLIYIGKFLFDNIIDKKVFREDFRKCEIDGKDIVEFSKEINEYYEHILASTELRRPRFCNKDPLKLNYVIRYLLGINIKITGKRKKVTVNQKRLDAYNYSLYIDDFDLNGKANYMDLRTVIGEPRLLPISYVEDLLCEVFRRFTYEGPRVYHRNYGFLDDDDDE
jgi:hypothetical protein